MATANFRSSVVKSVLRAHSGDDPKLRIVGSGVIMEVGSAKLIPVSKIGPFNDGLIILDRKRLHELSHKRPEVKVTFDRNGATLS